MVVALAGAEHRRGEARMVGAVGEVLGLERQRSAAAVGFAALAGQGAVEEITAVELNARFGRPNLHITPRSGFIDRSRQLQVMGAPARQHPIVVVAVAVAELFEIGIEARPDRCRTAEIHRRAFDGHQAAGGDERRIDGREEIGCDHQFMVVDRRPARPVQVEERVVREVDDRTAVGRGLVCDDEAVVVGQLVGHRNLQVPGVSLIAVGREAGQYDLLRRHLDDIPHNHVEALGTAVQAVGAVVQGQRILLPVERKAPCGDTVAVTADGGAEEPLSGLIDVSAEVVVPQHDVREIAVAVGHP